MNGGNWAFGDVHGFQTLRQSLTTKDLHSSFKNDYGYILNYYFGDCEMYNNVEQCQKNKQKKNNVCPS